MQCVDFRSDKKKNPKEDHAPFDIRYGGRGFDEEMPSFACVAKALKGGNSTKHVY